MAERQRRTAVSIIEEIREATVVKRQTSLRTSIARREGAVESRSSRCLNLLEAVNKGVGDAEEQAVEPDAAVRPDGRDESSPSWSGLGRSTITHEFSRTQRRPAVDSY